MGGTHRPQADTLTRGNTMRHRTFQSKEARDVAYHIARHHGERVRRSSIRNQLLHPMYVEDYEGPEKDDTGLGNTVYKTSFPVLYLLDHEA